MSKRLRGLVVDGSPDVDAAEKVARAVGDGGLGPHGALEEDFVV